MIVVAFALPNESQDLVASLSNQVRSGAPQLPVISGKYGTQEVTVLHTGMGAESAREQIQRYWQMHGARPIDLVIGSGFAGGLDPALPAGALLLAENYGGKLTAAREILGNRVRVGLLATSPTVLETAEAKAAYAKETGAHAVDMESATVGAFFQEKGIPFLVLRAISDAAGESFPVPSESLMDEKTQRPRPGALVWFLLCHPGRIRPFARFVGTIGRARAALTAALQELLVSI